MDNKQSTNYDKSFIENLILETINEVNIYLEKNNEANTLRELTTGEPKSYIAKLLWWNPEKKLSKTLYNIAHINKVMSEAYKYAYDTYRKKEYMKEFFSKDNVTKSYDIVYSLLEDGDSRKLFNYIVKCRIAYAFIGEEITKIYPLSIISELDSNKSDGVEPYKVKETLYRVKNYTVETTYELLKGSWVEGQYHYKDICSVIKGDIVISCGAFMGETAIWFADKTGKDGKVYSFEPTKNIFQIVERNIKRNNLNGIIKVFNCGVWNENTCLDFRISNNIEANACNSIVDVGGKEKIKVKKIDSFVKEENIIKIDFIKMDIEGAELNALNGASETICTYKPKLAICVYHNSDDLVQIPLYISSLVPEYKFYLSQKNSYETIVFACI